MANEPGVVRSILQTLHRIVYGRPRIPRPRELPSTSAEPPDRPKSWGSTSSGGRQYGPKTEPFTNPPLHILRKSQDLQKIYAELIRVSAERENRYKDYEDMILDPTIAGAIELMVDDTCQFNHERGATVWIKTEDSKIRRAGEELLDVVQIEDRIWDWAFNLATYGDWFIQPFAVEGLGVTLVQDDWHPGDVQRLDVNGGLIGFRSPRSEVETTQGLVDGDDAFWEPWQFVHFRIQASSRRRREVERQRMMPSTRFEKNDYRMTTRYGVSVVESVRRIYKQLQMVEQSLIISRMTRSLLKYVYKVQCGAASDPKSAAETVLAMKDLLTQQIGMRLGESLESQFSPMSGSEDVFLPVFGERGDVTIDKLGGEVDVRAIVDVDYLRKKMFGGLHVPAAFLGFSDDLPGSLGESALVRLAIQYARAVKRLQRGVVQGLTRLLQIHLAYKKIDPDPKRFSIEMDIISTAEEEERKSSLTSAISVAGSLTDLNKAMGLKMPVKEYAKLMYGEMLGLSGKFVDLIDQATEMPVDGEMGSGGADLGLPGGGGPGGADLGMPSEDEMEEPRPEDATDPTLDLPAPQGEETPEGALEPNLKQVAGTKPRVADRINEVGIRRQAKRQAMESVTKAVRQSPDVRSPLPILESDGTERSNLRGLLEDSNGKGEIIRSAVRYEKESHQREVDRQKVVMESIINDIVHVSKSVSYDAAAAETTKKLIDSLDPETCDPVKPKRGR